MGHTATGYDHLVDLTAEGLHADHILVSRSMKLQKPLDKSTGFPHTTWKKRLCSSPRTCVEKPRCAGIPSQLSLKRHFTHFLSRGWGTEATSHNTWSPDWSLRRELVNTAENAPTPLSSRPHPFQSSLQERLQDSCQQPATHQGCLMIKSALPGLFLKDFNLCPCSPWIFFFYHSLV